MAAIASYSINYPIAQEAYETFKKNKTLTILSNRPTVQIEATSELTFIGRTFLDKLSETKNVNTEKKYSFTNLNGVLRFLNQETLDEFTRITQEKFPCLTFLGIQTLIEPTTNTELVLPQIPPDWVISFDFDVVLKVKNFEAKLIPNAKKRGRKTELEKLSETSTDDAKRITRSGREF